MKIFYVVGSNSSKSLSPVIFNYWFKKYKINAKYSYIQPSKKNFDIKIKKALKDKNLCGLNITIPFKRKIIKHLDLLDSHSKQINAVNCVLIGKKLKGINTDWIGYFKTLPKTKNLNKKKVLIIGYGGAALAIHYVLKKKGFKNITIVNKTKKIIRFSNTKKFTLGISKIKNHIEKADIIINATPKNPINNRHSHLVRKKTILSDIVYQPKETSFLKKFPNNKKIYGISMLLEQAVPCFKLWFGFSPKIDKKLLTALDRKTK